MPLNPAFGNDGEHGIMAPGALVSKRLLTGKQDKSKFSEEQRTVWGEKEEEIFQDLCS